MPTAERHLTWDGCLNVRDLGGHSTPDGRTRFGAIVRADSVRQLSAAGWGALVAHGIRRIVDLRFRSELDADPPAELPVEVVHISLLGEPEQEALAAVEELRSTRDVYLMFLERYREYVARAITAVGEAPEGGVVVHCQGGKDRTGLIAALLLRLAGVAVDDAADDYSLSEGNLAQSSAEWIAQAPDEWERERRRRISATPSEAMREVLEELERRHGSVRAYLLEGGATEEALERARLRLVT